MLRSQVFPYPPHSPTPEFRIIVLTLPAGEEYTFPKLSSDRSVGSMYLSGGLIPDHMSGPAIEKHYEWRPRERWGIWKDGMDQRQTGSFRSGGEDAVWVCLEGNVEGDHLKAPATLPAGWFAFVINGSVVIDGQEGEFGNLFGPRETDMAVTGDGDLIIAKLK